jgi:hypothetical protein
MQYMTRIGACQKGPIALLFLRQILHRQAKLFAIALHIPSSSLDQARSRLKTTEKGKILVNRRLIHTMAVFRNMSWNLFGMMLAGKGPSLEHGVIWSYVPQLKNTLFVTINAFLLQAYWWVSLAAVHVMTCSAGQQTPAPHSQ